MKYFEFKVDVKTLFLKNKEDIETIKKNEKELSFKLKETISIIDELENKNADKKRTHGRFFSSISNPIREKERDFIIGINDYIMNESFNGFDMYAEKIKRRSIYFLCKIDDEDIDAYSLVDNIKNIIKKLIEKDVNSLLINEEDEQNIVEYLYGIEINANEVSFKRYYLKGLKNASLSGLDTSEYLARTGDSSIDEYSAKEINEFFIEYEIKNKITKEELFKKYKTAHYNKSLKEEIDRIYDYENTYNTKINPVHYEFLEYDETKRKDLIMALATALYSCGRISNNRVFTLKVDIMSSVLTSDFINRVLKNSNGSFVYFEFSADKSSRSRWTEYDYVERSKVRTGELTNNIKHFKDYVQFGFYIDKYQDKVRNAIYDELYSLNVLKIEEKVNPDDVENMIIDEAKRLNVELNDDFNDLIKKSNKDLNLNEAMELFNDYKDRLVIEKYFPQYKEVFNENDKAIPYAYDKLMSMPGLKKVKEVINSAIKFREVTKYRNEHFLNRDKDSILSERINGNIIPMNMIFMGNPGTCKTTVAKLFAEILKNRGIIKNNRTILYDKDYKREIKEAFINAYGGILFIDEAYSLNMKEIDELVELMENHKDDVIVILAGYTKKMMDFLKRNQGLKSRFKDYVEFEDYDEDELYAILKYMVNENKYILDEDVKEVLYPLFSSAQTDKDIGNGRFVRNVFEQAILNQSKRLAEKEINELKEEDFYKLIKEDFNIDEALLLSKKKIKHIGNEDPEIELSNMIGLDKVKNILKKSIATAKMSKIRRSKEDKKEKTNIGVNMHLAFLGNPGTAKTTVARLLARILKKKGVIKKDCIVEVGRKDLVGKYVGWTAPTVSKFFEQAKGGILFIDEAYSLVDDCSGSYGDEAINTIIAEMENHRDDVIVIFAGYIDRMKEFIERNEGLRSRISYVIEFDDYNNDELYKIFEKMISDENLQITEEAKGYVKDHIEKNAKGKDFGNGRFIRKFLENAKLNMDYRLSSLEKDDYTDTELTTLIKDDFIEIENDNLLDKTSNTLGFVA